MAPCRMGHLRSPVVHCENQKQCGFWTLVKDYIHTNVIQPEGYIEGERKMSAIHLLIISIPSMSKKWEAGILYSLKLRKSNKL